jgi:hypothetical protein
MQAAPEFVDNDGALATEERKSMADVVATNQKTILKNQAAILANQKTILRNQTAIKKNQNALESILVNQKEFSKIRRRLWRPYRSSGSRSRTRCVVRRGGAVS